MGSPGLVTGDSHLRVKPGILSFLKMRYWEIITDKLSKAGWSWGCVSTIDCNGQRIWMVDAHRGDGKRFVVRSDEKLAAFLELERITHELAVSALLSDGSN
jgi:hypothetical protein